MFFLSLYVYFLIERIKDSSVKRMDAFRIVLNRLIEITH